MTDEEILTKALEKAGMILYHWTYKQAMDKRAYFAIIFSHDFAKAFWGKVMTSCECYRFSESGHRFELHIPAWKFHLTQMVLEENPIQYLEKFL